MSFVNPGSMPIAFVVSLLVAMVVALRGKRLLLVLVTLSYVLSFVAQRIDPTWEDNGSIETITWVDTFGWALIFAPMFELVVVPIGLAIAFVVRRRKLRPT